VIHVHLAPRLLEPHVALAASFALKGECRGGSAGRLEFNDDFAGNIVLRVRMGDESEIQRSDDEKDSKQDEVLLVGCTPILSDYGLEELDSFAIFQTWNENSARPLSVSRVETDHFEIT
jgi:hypothetical protein